MDDTISRLMTDADFDAVDHVDARTRKAQADGGADLSAIDDLALMQAIDNPQQHAAVGQVLDPLKTAVQAI